jgi:hypothetical protein
MRTRLSELGVEPIVAEAVIAHRVGGVLTIYDRHSYLDEIRAALAKWEAHLFAGVLGQSPPNVVALGR